MFRILVSLLIITALSGCTEIELASHVAKNAMGTTSSGEPQAAAASSAAQQGNFKVGKPYNIGGTTYYPKEIYDHSETGIASWYGPGFHGKKTASGERFDTGELTAAHRTLQMPSLVRVTNLDNGKSVIVRVNDRGPFARGRVIDVSQRAAELLEFKNRGTAKVRLDVLTEESKQIAAMARQGQSTRGIEIAANQGRLNIPAPQQDDETYQTASYDAGAGGIGAVTSESLPAPNIAGHTAVDGRFMPDPVVTQLAVRPTNIYVQAGSFSVYDNAQRLSQALSALGPANVHDANVNGRQFYRVRVGPAPTVEAADRLLAQVVKLGHNTAIIVVD